MSVLITHFKHAIAFMRVAELGGFTPAANRLGISAAAVSKSVSLLEMELGAKLLNRTTRSISLTDEGELLLERLQAIQSEIETTEGQLAGASQQPRGKLRIHAPVGMGRTVIMPALLSLTKAYPGLTIDADFSDRIPNIAQENFDALIKIGDIPDSRLVARQLFKLSYFTCASPEYLERFGSPTHPEQLAQHNCLAYAQWNTGRYHEWDYVKNGRPYVFVPDGNLNVNHPEAIVDAVLSGAGIGRIASYIAAEGIRQGRLIVIMKDWTPPGKPVHLVYLPNRQMSSRIQVLTEALSAAIKTVDL